ncbi:bifunctional GNAT family N-acetyltransferase/acetate--CoA ligase family protein [Geodermatophilus sp. YIM 151500]|uniref:bifunctional acetate--CoA ligase family protein/GNAT family N-acetyltransferase n=1 Tax=Geodermatophilus sp. YIM 151500 TaxID=2984531 RepID=UPI0021E5031F|nr:bifunctional GNAT family N-acetyltransferase/acetate--CoA ligase family protein [Geodermatophilus sp. YIM 151500]MCV2488111.1 bifunctional GNAT family N-acetyltransferase/acetate--CoA ligase family protein [Geodermatophilus sp. YIM 151500]
MVAADGGTVHLRPITPDDADGLVGLMERSSEQTRYYRFFGPMQRLSQRDLHRFTHVDHVDRVAFVVLLGDQLIAVGRFDRLPGTDDAEVAFLVEDAHQGRGLGSVLLEHLAAAARERGITRFVAEVLTQNARMVRVFRDAGYVAERTYEDNIVHLTFPIAQTEDALAVAYEREQRSESRSIARLLTPASVAVVGASNDPGKLGNAVLRHLLDYGFAGPVYPVNPTARHVRGVPAYAGIEDIPDDVDLAVVAVPADEVAAVVEACRRKRVRGLVVISGGFGETGPEGRAVERRLVASARASGMRVVGPNCLGMVTTDPDVRLNASLAPKVPGRGRVGFFAQSGALGVALLERARSRNIGLSSFVSAGNRADVSGNDLLQYWATDPRTEVVLLHLESFGNPRKFARLARTVGRTKPVVAVKSGRHGGLTPGLAGTSVAVPEQSVGALFASAGVIRVETVAQLFDVGVLLAHQPLPAGERVAVVGNSTAMGVLVTDAVLEQGLVPAVDAPVDIGSGGGPDDFRAALQRAVDDPQVDAVVAVFLPPLMGGSAEFGAALLEVSTRSDKPVVATFLSTEGIPPELTAPGEDGMPERGSVPSFATPERAVIALAKVAEYARWRRRPVGTVPEFPDVDEPAGRRVVAGVLAQAPAGRELADEELIALLAAYGIPLLGTRRVTDAEQAVAAAEEIGYPVVLKSTAPWLRHRPDLGGTRLDLGDADAVRAAYAAIPAGDPMLVQEMAAPGVATVVEIVDDPSFGALVSFGLGGVATDLLGDRAFRALPLTDLDAAELVRAPRAFPLLDGYRGSEPADLAAVEDLLLRVARLADDLPEVLRLSLEPVLVGPATPWHGGRSLVVAGGTATVGPPTGRIDPGPRRMRSPV